MSERGRARRSTNLLQPYKWLCYISPKFDWLCQLISRTIYDVALTRSSLQRIAVPSTGSAGGRPSGGR